LKTPALASLLLLCPALVLAQQEVDRAATAPTQGNQLERVSVTRQQTDTDLRRREPVAKQLYGREELDKYGDTQLSDVLKRLPGINVTGGQLRMRGLGGAYTQILVNGEPAPPGFSLDNLNPAQVERLEVSKAPTADQSAQAIAGTLNIILKDAPRVVQKDLRVGLAYASEKPVINAGFTYGDRVVGGLGFVLPINFQQWNFVNESEGDRVRDGGLTGLRNTGRDRAYGHNINIAPRLNWKLGDDETLSLQGFFINNKFRNQGSNTTEVLFADPAMPSKSVLPPSLLDTTRNRGTFAAQRVNLQYNNRFGEDRRIELRAGAGSGGADFNFEFFGRNKDGSPAIDRITSGENRNRNATLSAKYSQYAGEAHTITTGAELDRRTRDEIRSTRQLDYRPRPGDPNWTPKWEDLLTGVEGQPFNATSTRSAVYVQDEWEINKQWSAYAGVRHEQIETASDGQGSQFNSTSKVTTPLLHVNFKPDPKNRDLVRASLTRSYKAADVQQLIARPTVNTDYEVRGPNARINTELGPDRTGNPALKPELATGLDIAYERYLPAGGLMSVGVFHRRITNLIRTDRPRLMTVDYADTQRYVITQVNLAKATTQGLELEIKGRASELFPSLFEPSTALNMRASLNLYRSRVADIPGPDNRLEGQQPWQFNFGADYRFKSLPINMGFSAQIAPEFDVRQSVIQSQTSLASRSVDAFAAMQVSKQDSVRVSVNGLFQPKQGTRVVIIDTPDYNLNRRQPVAWWSVNWEHKF
jgi:outer membrane receptor for ferrienterochelin and colicins